MIDETIEFDKLHKDFNSNLNSTQASFCYLLSLKFLEQWKKNIEEGDPSVLSSLRLMQVNKDLVLSEKERSIYLEYKDEPYLNLPLKAGLKETVDFTYIPKSCWDIVTARFRRAVALRRPIIR